MMTRTNPLISFKLDCFYCYLLNLTLFSTLFIFSFYHPQIINLFFLSFFTLYIFHFQCTFVLID